MGKRAAIERRDATSGNSLGVSKRKLLGERVMRWNVSRASSKGLRRVAVAIVVAGSFAAPAAYAKPADNFIVVPPTDLPEVARQTGDAMFLHGTVDGRTLLYIERNQGAELAVLDVTDPGHVKAANAQDIHGVVDVKQVLEEISNSDTGTTFLLTDRGLYLIRRPAVEMRNKARERDVELGNAGAG